MRSVRYRIAEHFDLAGWKVRVDVFLFASAYRAGDGHDELAAGLVGRGNQARGLPMNRTRPALSRSHP